MEEASLRIAPMRHPIDRHPSMHPDHLMGAKQLGKVLTVCISAHQKKETLNRFICQKKRAMKNSQNNVTTMVQTHASADELGTVLFAKMSLICQHHLP